MKKRVFSVKLKLTNLKKKENKGSHKVRFDQNELCGIRLRKIKDLNVHLKRIIWIRLNSKMVITIY